MPEYRVYGGPGCGKTTYLSKQIREAVRRFGPRAVLVCSFSNAAANELVTRDLPIPSRNVGTLHSFCRRAIDGQQEIAETIPKLEEWNAKNAQMGFYVPRSSRGLVGGAKDAAGKDGRIWAEYGQLRNQMVPVDDWPVKVQQFHELWTVWKAEQDVIDFTDLIEIVASEGLECPESIDVLFADEAQDYSRLEMTVVRAWGEAAQWFVLAGDDQQALYDFRGASAEVLLSPELPPEQVTILDQSYRLPSVVLDYAQAYGNTMDRFQRKDIKPLEPGGEVQRAPWHVGTRAAVDAVVAEAATGQTVMVLATCDYMLSPLLKQLRAMGVLFHNPYRPTHGGWNPRRGGVERLLKFLMPDDQTRWRHVWAWFEHLDARNAGLIHGAKEHVKSSAKDKAERDELVTRKDLEMLTGFSADITDLRDYLLSGRRRLYDYAHTVLDKHGADGLRADALIIPGTLHAVKGGEADVVFVCPDLSPAAAKRDGSDSDVTRRAMYVGMTRAKKKLILIEPSGPAAKLPDAPLYTLPAEVPF